VFLYSHGVLLMKEYVVLLDGSYAHGSLRSIVERSRRDDETLWSARLATGLFGSPRCPAGRRGPKGKREVILAQGASGLTELVDLGFIPCPVCKPETSPGFWEAVGVKAEEKYGVTSAAAFSDKTVVPFDALMINWEELAPIIQGVPGRLYVAPRLAQNDVKGIVDRFLCIGSGVPAIGCYDANAPGRFRQYDVEIRPYRRPHDHSSGI